MLYKNDEDKLNYYKEKMKYYKQKLDDINGGGECPGAKDKSKTNEQRDIEREKCSAVEKKKRDKEQADATQQKKKLLVSFNAKLKEFNAKLIVLNTKYKSENKDELRIIPDNEIHTIEMTYNTIKQRNPNYDDDKFKKIVPELLKLSSNISAQDAILNVNQY